MFKCPVCGDVRESIQALKHHFQQSHRTLGNTCLVCGKKVKCLEIHCAKKYSKAGCKQHLAFYYLVTSHYKKNTLLKLARATAEEVFRVEESKSEKYRCPLCGKTYYLHQLKKHFYLDHDRKYCYICNKKVKLLAKHCLSKWHDENHRILYWLARNPQKYEPTQNKLKEAEKIVRQRLLVVD